MLLSFCVLPPLQHWRRMPNYSVMVDQKYNRGNYAYCAEENIVSVRNVQVGRTGSSVLNTYMHTCTHTLLNRLPPIS